MVTSLIDTGIENASDTVQMETLAWPYILSVPFFHVLATGVKWKKGRKGFDPSKPYTRFYDGACPATLKIREGAARWPALEVIYNWKPQHGGITGLIEQYWLNMRSAQAVRNRFKIVTKLVRAQAMTVLNRQGSVNVMSIASGSGQCIFEALKGLPNVNILCVDSDPTAIVHSQEMACRYGFSNITWYENDILKPGAVSRATGFNPDIVEMVGLIDYLSDSTIVNLCNRVYDVLADKGTLVTGHIHRNPETYFLEVVSDWKMKYRTKKQLIALLNTSRFGYCEAHTEPHNIFTVVTSQKITTAISPTSVLY